MAREFQEEEGGKILVVKVSRKFVKTDIAHVCDGIAHISRRTFRRPGRAIIIETSCRHNQRHWVNRLS